MPPFRKPLPTPKSPFRPLRSARSAGCLTPRKTRRQRSRFSRRARPAAPNASRTQCAQFQSAYGCRPSTRATCGALRTIRRTWRAFRFSCRRWQTGNPLVNLFGLTAEEVAGKIARHKITHISATPTFYRMLAGAGAEFPNVVRATFGGERVDEALCRRVEKMFPSAKINNVYASTEAGALFACDGDAFSIPPDIADSVKISDGEILLRRDILGTSESFSFDADGFYRTGDKIEWADAEKTKFRIVARANGMVNVGGYKVNPAEVEARAARGGGNRRRRGVRQKKFGSRQHSLRRHRSRARSGNRRADAAEKTCRIAATIQNSANRKIRRKT